MENQDPIRIIGGGLAGCEAAYFLAERGFAVELIEQKPTAKTPAQTGEGLGELVCSNSFRGASLTNAVGLLKEEMRLAGSLLMRVAAETRVPAGGALAVDREAFSERMTAMIDAHPGITRVCETVREVPATGPAIIATGPLTGDELAADLAKVIGQEHLAYYDAIAPIVSSESIDWDKVYIASRYGKKFGDEEDAYVNCPFTKEQYFAFIKAILDAEKVQPRSFEKIKYFEGCLPVEVMAERGEMTLAFGPMKPVGLPDPKTGKDPFAVIQLRPENRDKSAYNLVGFQTRMKWGPQGEVWRMIPGLENADFMRFGTVHRNTFVNAPETLDGGFFLKERQNIALAGQITGVEGYVESAACGLLVAITMAGRLRGQEVALPPETTALGGLARHLQTPRKRFQPSNVTWAMVPGPKKRRGQKKHERYAMMAQRALEELSPWLKENQLAPLPGAQESLALPMSAQ